MQINTLLGGAAVCALAWSAPAIAQDEAGEDSAAIVGVFSKKPEIIVSAARDTGLETQDFTGSVTVITPEQLEQRQVRNIEDVLRDVPGVAVAVTPGQTQIRLRGSEANHVLVLVDGIEVSDPGSGEYDLGTLQAEIGSRLEVVRGPQSALFGNDAIGGVVGYSTASGRELEGFSAFAEGGTNTTINAAARAGFGGSSWDFALSGIVVSTNGEPNARGGTRDIGRDGYTVSGKGSVNLTDSLSLRAVGRYVLTQGDFNEQSFFGPTAGLVIDSPGTTFRNEAVSGLVGARLELFDGSWVHDLSAQFTDANRRTSQPAGFPSSTESDRFKASYITSYDFGGTASTLTFATDYELEGFNNVLTFNSRNEVENFGFVGEYRYAGERFDFAAAVRHDVNDLFQDFTTFRIGAGARVTGSTRFRAAIGTGIKNPTLNELFGFFSGQFVGNPDLLPEESLSWEVGVDQSFADEALTLSATFFVAELENEIFSVFDPVTFVSSPDNRTTESRQQGIELALAARIGPQFSLNAAYTYLDAEENGVTELRRPESIASAALTWTAPDEAASATLIVRHNGEALDSDFGTFSTVALDDYTLINLNAQVRLGEGIELFARAENLLDQRYEQVFGFVAPGRQVIGGITASF